MTILYRKFKSLIHKRKEPKFKYTRELLPSDIASVGEHTYGNPEIFFNDSGCKLSIGKFCSIAGNVSIFLGGNHRTDWISTYPFNVLYEPFPNARRIEGHPSSKGDVVIGNDVWIGAGVKILSGVKIGDGAVLGAYSVITKDVGDYEIWAGNPAKLIKKRFESEHIDLLIRIKWWDWPLEKINQNVDILCSDDFEKLKKII